MKLRFLALGSSLGEQRKELHFGKYYFIIYFIFKYFNKINNTFYNKIQNFYKLMSL